MLSGGGCGVTAGGGGQTGDRRGGGGRRFARRRRLRWGGGRGGNGRAAYSRGLGGGCGLRGRDAGRSRRSLHRFFHGGQPLFLLVGDKRGLPLAELAQRKAQRFHLGGIAGVGI